MDGERVVVVGWVVVGMSRGVVGMRGMKEIKWNGAGWVDGL